MRILIILQSLGLVSKIAQFKSYAAGLYAMTREMQPIRIQDSYCVFDSVTHNLSIVRRAYVALIVLAGYSVFCGIV